jgi:hypothetical protein
MYMYMYVNVRFVDIGGIVDHHCLNFLFIIDIKSVSVIIGFCPKSNGL